MEELKIDIDVVVASEDVLVSVSRDGYIKRTSLRSYAASNEEDLTLKDEDYLIYLGEVNTTDHVLLFTNKGKYIFIPVHELLDIRWKEMGQHVSNITTFDKDECLIKCIPIREFKDGQYIVFFTKNGMVKRTELKHYHAGRHSKSLIAINLKDDDEVVNIHKTDGNFDIFIASNKGYGLWYHESEVTVVGQRALGVKSIQLKDGEYVVGGQVFDDLSEPSIVIITQRGAVKRMKLSEFEKSTRAKRGLIMLRELKSKPHRICGLFVINDNEKIRLRTKDGHMEVVHPLELTASERYSNGSFVVDTDAHGEVTEVWKEAEYSKPFEKQED